jgi:transporter family protein
MNAAGNTGDTANSSWLLFALLSALFAGMTAILAKAGIKGVNSDLATALRTIVIVVFAWGIVLARGEAAGMRQLTPTNWTFLFLSGLATGASWLCYFRALSLGPVSHVAPIDKLSFVIAVALGILIFREKLTPYLALGVCLIVVGVWCTLQDKSAPDANKALPITGAEKTTHANPLTNDHKESDTPSTSTASGER